MCDKIKIFLKFAHLCCVCALISLAYTKCKYWHREGKCLQYSMRNLESVIILWKKEKREIAIVFGTYHRLLRLFLHDLTRWLNNLLGLLWLRCLMWWMLSLCLLLLLQLCGCCCGCATGRQCCRYRRCIWWWMWYSGWGWTGWWCGWLRSGRYNTARIQGFTATKALQKSKEKTGKPVIN